MSSGHEMWDQNFYDQYRNWSHALQVEKRKKGREFRNKQKADRIAADKAAAAL